MNQHYITAIDTVTLAQRIADAACELGAAGYLVAAVATQLIESHAGDDGQRYHYWESIIYARPRAQGATAA